MRVQAKPKELTKMIISKQGKVTILDLWEPVYRALFFRQQTASKYPVKPLPINPQEKRDFDVLHVGLHYGEEPFLTGGGATAAVYFAKCNLKCRDCTDSSYASRSFSTASLFSELEDCISRGAKSISFVTPTLYAKKLTPLLQLLKKRYPTLPLIYNCGGYESPSVIAVLSRYIDIFLPDCKALSKQGIKSRNLPENYAARFLGLFHSITKTHPLAWSGSQLIRGVVVRHLLHPGGDLELNLILAAFAPYRRHFLLNMMTNYYDAKRHTILPQRLTLEQLTKAGRYYSYINGTPLSQTECHEC